MSRFPVSPVFGLVLLTAFAGASAAMAFEAGLRLEPLTDLDMTTTAGIASPPLLGWMTLVALAVGLAGGGLAMVPLRRRLAFARREARVSRALYDQLAEQTGDVVLRLMGAQVEVSASIEALVGYSVEEMRALPLVDLVHAEDRQRVIDEMRSLGRSRPRCELTCRMLHRDGRTVWVDATFGRHAAETGEAQTIVTIRDITRRQDEAEALRVASQAAEMARKAADAANRAKSDFVASMSHELRTPLNAIIGFADLLARAPDLSDAMRRQVDRIRGGGDALLTIVNDILHFSEAESGTLRLDPRPFSLPLLVDSCVSLVEGAAVDRHLALRVELKDRFPAGLLGDEARLRQILLNLLNNAIKFTCEGSVTLTIGYDRALSRDRVLFEVTDTGIGVATEDLARLFQRFSQVDGSIRRTYGGTGLGLAISKMLVDLMGGEMGVRSTVGQGSTFWFALDLKTVPLVLEAPGPSTRKAMARAAARPLDILLVEDIPINQELAAAIIRVSGHRVDIVGDGADAIMAVEGKAYDLVLMDVQMPYVDGLTATREIRASAHPNRFVPIVAMTANVLPDQVAAARAAGMDDVLAKPIDIEALNRLLARGPVVPVEAQVDEVELSKLVRLLGAAKVEGMLATLARSLIARFNRPLSPDSEVMLKRDAHASVAGAGMLGFHAFAKACRDFMAAEAAEDLDRTHVALMCELKAVVTTAGRLSRDLAPIAQRHAA